MSAPATSGIARGTIEAGGRRLSVLRGGPARAPVLFLHGGVPGRTLYCGGAHEWQDYLALAARERHAIAADLPGFGGSEPEGPFRIDTAACGALALIEAVALGPCHVVGHDEGGLIALALAIAAPAAIRSISIVASPAAAPAGDSVENLTLAFPPGPPWSRETQAWALTRLSHDPAHVDAALLDRCVAAAAGAAHAKAVAHARSGATARALADSAGKAKSDFYSLCREKPFPVPAQIVWGSDDPMTTVEHGRVLFGVIAQRQTATQFHVINRTGHFPFREAPGAFHHVVAAFHEGLDG